MSTVEPCVKRTSSTGDTIAMWRSEPAPTQTTVLERSVRSMKIGTPAGGGNGPTPPGETPVAATTSGGRATRTSVAPAATPTLAGSARRSPGTSASTGRSAQTKTSDFTIWSRSHPIASAAPCADAAADVNSSSRDSAPEARRKTATRSTGSGQDIANVLSELDEDRVAEAHAVHLLDERLRGRLVDGQRHQSLLAVARPRDGHVRDVRAVVAEERADLADHAGNVVVAEEHHVGGELDVDPEPVRAREEQARLGPDRRSRDLHLFAALRRHAYLEDVHVVTRGAEPFLRDRDPALGREQGCVDVVDGLVDPATEDAVERSDRQQPRVEIGDRPVCRDDDPPRPSAGELDGQPPELRRQGNERAEHVERRLVDNRDVDGIRDETAVERSHDLLRDDHPGPVLRLVRGGSEVRRQDDAVELEQRTVVRLLGEDVESGACQLPGGQRLRQRLFVDERAAGSVYEPRPVLHLRDRRAIDHPARLVGER